MTPSESISILICANSTNSNYDKLLIRSVESLRRQTYSHFETVIVLDGCWSETEDNLNTYLSDNNLRNLKIIKKKDKRGLAVAKNFGLKYCSGDWVAFLDADDQYMDCKIEVQRDFLLKNENIDLCFTNAWDLDKDRVNINCFSVDDYRNDAEIKEALKKENVLCHGSAMIRKSVLESLGGYSEDVKHLGIEDWEMWNRAALIGFKFCKIPERLYIYSLNTSVNR